LNIHLKNGRLIDPVSGKQDSLDMLIVDGMIEKIGRVSATTQLKVIDLAGKVIAPGFLDMHVHLREPGFEYKETIETGLLAAASGGFTALCCMPNTNPTLDEAPIVRHVLERAKSVQNGIVDLYPIAAITRNREGKELSPMMELAHCGVVGFSDDGAPVESAEVMRRAMEYASMLKKPIIQHAEDPSLTKGGVMNEGFVSTSLGMQPIPPVAEVVMVARDLILAEYTGAQYHVAHISTAGAVELLRGAKKKNQDVSAEAAPHHFSLTEESVRSFDTNTKMNPPLRTRQDVEAVKEGLRDGTIEVIATDHAPHSYDDKQVEFMYAPFGIVGLETALGLAIRELLESKVLSLYQLVEKFSTNPRRILHLPPINIAEGEAANLTLFDPDLEWVVDCSQFKSKSRNTPFGTWKLKGKALGIINNGHLYSEGGFGMS